MKKNKSGKSQDGFITRNLYKVSLLIYRKLIRKKQMPGAENVRACLSALYDTGDLNEIEEDYYANKISIVLLVVIAGCFLALMLHLSTIHNTLVEDGNVVRRRLPGKGEQTLELIAKTEEGLSSACSDILLSPTNCRPLAQRAALGEGLYGRIWTRAL